MIITRLPSDTTSIETDYGKLHLHICYTNDGRPCGIAVSHQIKDMNSQIAELIETIATGIDAALRP
jgi:hypothetical protein